MNYKNYKTELQSLKAQYASTCDNLKERQNVDLDNVVSSWDIFIAKEMPATTRSAILTRLVDTESYTEILEIVKPTQTLEADVIMQKYTAELRKLTAEFKDDIADLKAHFCYGETRLKINQIQQTAENIFEKSVRDEPLQGTWKASQIQTSNLIIPPTETHMSTFEPRYLLPMCIKLSQFFKKTDNVVITCQYIDINLLHITAHTTP